MIICVCVFTFACLSAFSPHVLCACSHSQICLGFRPRASQLSVLTYTFPHRLCLLLCACNSAAFGSSDCSDSSFLVAAMEGTEGQAAKQQDWGHVHKSHPHFANRIHIPHMTYVICMHTFPSTSHTSHPHFAPAFCIHISQPHVPHSLALDRSRPRRNRRWQRLVKVVN